MQKSQSRQDSQIYDEESSQNLDDSSEESSYEEAGEGDKYVCKCGKYSGDAHNAYNNHVNKYHKNNKDQYNKELKNPRKDPTKPKSSEVPQMEQNNHNHYKIASYKHDPQQVLLSSFANITAQRLKDNYKEIPNQNKIVRIDPDDDIDEDSDNEKDKEKGRRSRKFNQKLHELAKRYSMEKIISEGNDGQLKTFKTHIYDLNLIYDLSKRFIGDTGVKIDFSLKIIHAFEKKKLSSSEKEKIMNVLDEIWSEVPKNKDGLFFYYREWNKIRIREEKKK